MELKPAVVKIAVPIHYGCGGVLRPHDDLGWHCPACGSNSKTLEGRIVALDPVQIVLELEYQEVELSDVRPARKHQKPALRGNRKRTRP